MPGVVLRILAGLGLCAFAGAALAAPVTVSQPTEVRASPGLIFGVVNLIEPGQVVERGACNPSATWCFVEMPAGADGWAPADALRAPLSEAELPLEGVRPGDELLLVPEEVLVEVVALATVNIRSAPGLDNDIIGRLPAEATAIRHDCVGEDTWCRIAYGEIAGWVSAAYLSVSRVIEAAPVGAPAVEAAPETALPAPPSVPAVEGATPATVASAVNLRSGPGREHAVIAVLQPGEAVMRGACTEFGHWCHVTTGADFAGWVGADFIVPAAPVPPVTSADLPDLPPPLPAE